MSIELEYLYYLMFWFVIYSVLGWILESIYKSILQKKPINSGFMHGPYCPIYGFGALIMILALQSFKYNITLLFIASFVILSFWEYLVSFVLEKIYHAKYWDYSSQKINLNGRVCLKNSVYWGILGVLFTIIFQPNIEKYSMMIPNDIIICIDVLIGIAMIADFTISSVKAQALIRNIRKIKDISENIKESLEELKAERNNEIINSNLNKMQLSKNKLKVQIYRQLQRTKRAFPTMNSEEGTKFIGGKIDVDELKSRIGKLKNKIKDLKENIKLGKRALDTEEEDKEI